MARERKPLLTDRYEEWLKSRVAKPARRVEGKKVEPDLYELWLARRIEKR